MKRIIIALATLLSVELVAFGANERGHDFGRNVRKVHEGMTPEQIQAKKAELHEATLMRTGGKLRKPGVGKGKFVVCNGQSRVDAESAMASVKQMSAQLRVEVELQPFDGNVTPKTASEKLKQTGGAAAVFIVDDADLPITLLTAPEAKWSIVNVAALAADGASPAFVSARVRKEAARGLLMACGGYDAQKAGTLMSTVTTLKELDEFDGTSLPIDVLNRVLRSLPSYGIERWVISTYYEACLEGWAPAPTDKYQQAVWDRVHEMPTEPIVIKAGE